VIRPVKYVGDERYSFQGDTPAEVLRVVWYDMAPDARRLCVHLRYPDGREDYAPLEEAMQNGYFR
jgi:hypothetical protein